MSDRPPYVVVHLDDHLVVVEKDGGVLTVPSHGEPGVVDLLQAELDRVRFGRHRIAAAHRLDRGTSGLLLFARSPVVAAALAKQLAGESVEREYVAIVAGVVQDDEGTLASPVDGKSAVTHFRVLRRLADATLVAAVLETGRRNQIRAHFAERGHPVLGETRFLVEQARHPRWPHARLALHARLLGFTHPVTRERLRFEAPLPESFVDFQSPRETDDV